MKKKKDFKPLTTSAITKRTRILFESMKSIYNQIDDLMDETELTTECITDREAYSRQADNLNEIANILLCARDNALQSCDELETILIAHNVY